MNNIYSVTKAKVENNKPRAKTKFNRNFNQFLGLCF